MLIISRTWKPVTALAVAGALSLGLISPALAQEGNQPPAPGDDTATTAAETAVQIDVLANDSDPDGQGIFLTEWTQGTGGTVDVTDAIVTYTPAADFSGEDTFTYTVSDGEDTATATVTVTVEEAVVEGPEAVDDTTTTTAGTAVDIDVLANDTGAEGATLSIEAVGSPANGTAEVVEGVVVYTPAAEFTGEDTFEYTVSDGENTATATVIVTVEEAVVEGPEAVDDTATTTVGTAVDIDVLANDTGAEGATLSIEAVGPPANGTAEVVEGVVVYTPAAEFTGEDMFEYTVSDGGNTDTATVTVTVEEDVVEGLDPAVVEACEGYTGDDGSIKLLCRVYMSGNLSPFIQQIVGSIILLTMPPVVVDPVVEACEANAGDPLVDALCGLYENENAPDFIREQVGQWILDLTAAVEEPAPEEQAVE